jgi:hypothetical protein
MEPGHEALNPLPLQADADNLMYRFLDRDQGTTVSHARYPSGGSVELLTLAPLQANPVVGEREAFA